MVTRSLDNRFVLFTFAVYEGAPNGAPSILSLFVIHSIASVLIMNCLTTHVVDDRFNTPTKYWMDLTQSFPLLGDKMHNDIIITNAFQRKKRHCFSFIRGCYRVFREALG